MQASQPNLFIVYVDDPQVSAPFYTRLMGREPVFAVPTFVSYDLGSGFMLSLISRKSDAATPGKDFELAFTVEDAAKVDALHEDWSRNGVDIAQAPYDARFGRTFVARDPDGHLLRVNLAD